MRVAGIALVLSLLLVSVYAEEKPPSPGKAADEVLAAHGAKNNATMAALAARAVPDPWLVADELCRRGEHEAAKAFGRALPKKKPAVAKLAKYVASRRKARYDDAEPMALTKAEQALAAKDPEQAIKALASCAARGKDVTSIRVLTLRGSAQREAKQGARSVATLDRAAAAADKLGWLKGASEAYTQSGLTAYVEKDWSEARDRWQKARAHFASLGEWRDLVTTCKNIAAVCRRLGDLDAAAAVFVTTGAEVERLGELEWAAYILALGSDEFKAMGKNREALELLARAVTLCERCGSVVGKAGHLLDQGTILRHMGKREEALELQKKSLALFRSQGHRHKEGVALGNMGNSLKALGRYDEALECMQSALKLLTETGDQAGVARVHQGMGTVYDDLGRSAKALAAHEKSLAIYRALGMPVKAAGCLINIGSVHKSLGDNKRALKALEEAYGVCEKAGNLRYAAAALTNMGLCHMELGSLEDALRCHEQALVLVKQLGDSRGLSSTLDNLAVVHARRGDFKKALTCADQALTQSRETGDRPGVAQGLADLGAIHEQAKDYRKCLSTSTEALVEAEEIGTPRVQVQALSQIARSHYRLEEWDKALAVARDAVTRAADLFGGLADEQGARYRAESRRVFRIGMAASFTSERPEEFIYFAESGRAGALLEVLGGSEALAAARIPAALLEEEAKARKTVHDALVRQAAAAGRRKLREIVKAKREVAAAREGLSEVIDRIQREAKEAADVAYPRPASLAKIRSWLGETDALVLYATLYTDTIALVVTRGDVRLVELASNEAIGEACAALALESPDDDPAAAIVALTKIVVTPLGLGAKIRRVLISPSGALSHVPFAVLMRDRDVVYEPSATTYGLLRGLKTEPGKGVLALGDPVYPKKGDPVRFGKVLVALPATRQEALAVGTVTLLGAEASETGLAQALGGRARWRAVHFACHGLVDSTNPSNSALAITPDAGNDGLLTLLEVFRMRISADLVTLSACETAQGKVYQSEGIVGLTRAFMMAGAPRVICSLWKVDDEATQALMSKFYETWGPEVPASTALRRAQEHVRSQVRWEHPYYWAAWVLWGLPE